MKVLWFSNSPALGSEYLNEGFQIKGTGGWIYSLNKELQNHIDLSVAFHYPYKKREFAVEKTSYFPIYTGNIIIEALRKRFFNVVYDLEYTLKYLNIINFLKPDIIHIHGTENSFLGIIEKTEIPVVVSFQGNINVIYHKYLSGFHGKYLSEGDLQLSLRGILFGRSNFKKNMNQYKKMADIEQSRMKFIKHLIGRTDWDRRVSRILSPESVYYRGGEILRDSFYNKCWNNMYRGGKLIIMSVTGNSYYKGFETGAHALKLLIAKGFDVEWRFAGITDESLINKITKKFLGAEYPQKGLKLLGTLNQEELIENLLESHIFIMTSHIENSPNNLSEAMILGMPCISTFAGGTSSILKDQEEGILIQDGDPWAMAGAVIEMIQNTQMAKEYGIKARESSLKRHDKQTVTNQYLAIYSKILEDKSI
ncbi:MAG: glycosyltransferase [Ignavibacteriales bacterium]|nr:MAG: glycosyltransferase [Ignavibacteriales bacterium]